MRFPLEETMKVVRGNLETLRENLDRHGYQFEQPQSALPGIDPAIAQKLSFIQAKIGEIPLALKCFYRVVGSVDFCGYHPAWHGCEYPDPMLILPVDAALSEALEFLELENPEEYWGSDQGRFRIPIAPDRFHKAGVSGGMWSGIEIPNAQEDPALLEEWHHTTFLGYLRICFQWGGFPGLEQDGADHTWPVDELRHGLAAM